MATLDGLGTFHGMGMISMTTPCGSGLHTPAVESVACGMYGNKPVKRLQRAAVDTIACAKVVKIHHFSTPNIPPLLNIHFKPVVELHFPYVQPPSINLDLLWKVGWYFCGESEPRPSWSGFMQNVVLAEHHSPTNIHFLPIIDMHPSDKSLSTLLFIINQAKLLNIETPCVTFDQPLWIKAVEVAESESLNVVCRLGVFHMVMSFLGSIGNVMSGSGLCEALETCYGPNTVSQIMCGKAFARAMRAHSLVESALYVLLLKYVFDSDDVSEDDIADLRAVYDSVVTGTSDVTIPQCLVKLHMHCHDQKSTLAAASRTARLWLQYMEYVDVLRMVVRAERTSDWNLHLIGVSKMLNLFAATGHSHYTKCARLYLQMMMERPTTHAWLHGKFLCGYSVRRSRQFWAGLSTDLIIEQVLMRSLEGQGGLTHGGGMTDSVRSLWVHSMHECASVHAAVNALAGMDIDDTGPCHVELTKARRTQDFVDLQKLLGWFAAHNPLDVSGSRLRNVGTGVVAGDDDKITCDTAEDVVSE